MDSKTESKEGKRLVEAAGRWKRQCLLDERSLLTDRSLWTRENFERLYGLFVENPDESDDDFVVKLQRQLEPGPPDTKCLWAEMSWVYHLIQTPRAMKPTTKRTRIEKIWRWSGRDLPDNHELLTDSVLGSGIVTTGNAYGQHSWREYVFFVAAMRAWFSEVRNWRESIFGDPWKFASWVDDQEYAANRMFRHAILFLLFPDVFEPIVSSGNKKKIVTKLHRGDWPDNAVAMDRALLTIREQLEEQHPGFGYYRSPIAEMWESRARKRDTEEKDERRQAVPGRTRTGPNGSYGADQALEDIFVPRADFERILSSIKRRRNLILQGPPGTGKTFLARRIAWCLMGRKDNDPIEFVQFHQSYAYEDFVQGYRPTDGGGFERKNGVFLRFCSRARNSKVPHILIVDEINRGNLSRIFGELLMLIEADKRSKDYAVALTYSGARDEPFFVPDNLYILGTMNTADRSLAVVDYALRRRFVFETLEPAFGTGQFEKCLRARGAAAKLITRISRRMVALNETIRGDKELGRGFQIGHSYFVPGDRDEPTDDWYEDVVDTQIAPLLHEYWFDSPEDVETEVGKLKAV